MTSVYDAWMMLADFERWDDEQLDSFDWDVESPFPEMKECHAMFGTAVTLWNAGLVQRALDLLAYIALGLEFFHDNPAETTREFFYDWLDRLPAAMSEHEVAVGYIGTIRDKLNLVH